MPTEYGADAQITGSLQVDGDIILGTGDDEVILKGLTYSSETKTGPGDDGASLSIYLPLSILNSSGGTLRATLPDGVQDFQLLDILGLQLSPFQVRLGKILHRVPLLLLTLPLLFT